MVVVHRFAQGGYRNLAMIDTFNAYKIQLWPIPTYLFYEGVGRGTRFVIDKEIKQNLIV